MSKPTITTAAIGSQVQWPGKNGQKVGVFMAIVEAGENARQKLPDTKISATPTANFRRVIVKANDGSFYTPPAGVVQVMKLAEPSIFDTMIEKLNQTRARHSLLKIQQNQAVEQFKKLETQRQELRDLISGLGRQISEIESSLNPDESQKPKQLGVRDFFNNFWSDGRVRTRSDLFRAAKKQFTADISNTLNNYLFEATKNNHLVRIGRGEYQLRQAS